MSYDEKVEVFLEMPYYVVDFLPVLVEKDSDGQFFEVEEFFLSEKAEQMSICFAELLLKLNCYVDFQVSLNGEGVWEENPKPVKLYENILKYRKKCKFINIIMEKEDSMIQVNRDDLYLTVFHPSEKIKMLLSALCVGYGLFFREGRGS